MTKLYPLLFVALAACGQGDSANESPIATADGADPQDNGAAAGQPAPARATDSEVAPRLSEVQTYRDWSVACDNGRNCEAVSLAPGEANLQDIGLIVRRPAGTEGAVAVTLRSPSAQTGAAELLADGKRVAGSTWSGEGIALFDATASARIAAALPNARSLTVRGAGAETATISPAGVSAALRYMDAQQGRAGTRTALVARGDQPFTAATPALPVVVAVPLARGEAPAPSAALVAEMRRASDCPADDVGTPSEQAFKLSERDTLVLISCGAGAYNAIAAPFVVTDGAAREAPFDEGFSFGEPGSDTRIINGDWDSAAGRLFSYAKGRGLGDCGTSSTWVWDGGRFRLIEAETEGNCRGAVKWPRVWTARVVRQGSN